MSFNYKALWIKADAEPKSVIHPKISHTVNIQKYFLSLTNFYLRDEIQLKGALDSELELPKAQQKPILYEFFDTLASALQVMGGKISPFEPFLTYRYSSQILCLEDEIYETMDLMLAHILLDALKQEQQDFYQELQPEDLRSTLKDSICKQASMLTNYAFPNTKLLQQMCLADLGETSEMGEGFTCSAYGIAAVRSQFYVGLEKWIGDLKRPLFQYEVSVVGVRCMTGYFQTLVFITVSQSPNVKGFLEALWDNIIGSKRSEFQNLEDARKQQQLLRQSKSTLLISDDVRSRANLEKLLFQVAGYKTLFTTRDSFIIPRSHSTQFYQLPLLGQEDALSLFCMHGEPCEAWESAKNKIFKGELVSDYHIDGLLRFLETSIRFLDDVARRCFLDLSAFPKDKKICATADALVHIWVYVQKLEWLEAFAILLELACRNLLNLPRNPRSTAAISHGNGSCRRIGHLMLKLSLFTQVG